MNGEKLQSCAEVMPRRGLLCCVSGPSGVGKGSALDRVIERDPSLCHSISVTTRLPRAHEREGVDYYFIDKPRFEQMLAAGEILEYDVYCDNYYGTPAAPIHRMIAEGRTVLLDITVAGTLAILEQKLPAVTIFLVPPSLAELRNRLERRGSETDLSLARRLRQAGEELNLTGYFDYTIVNDRLEETASQILAILTAERCRTSRMTDVHRRLIAERDTAQNETN